jgi:hypothetical protein
VHLAGPAHRADADGQGGGEPPAVLGDRTGVVADVLAEVQAGRGAGARAPRAAGDRPTAGADLAAPQQQGRLAYFSQSGTSMSSSVWRLARGRSGLGAPTA